MSCTDIELAEAAWEYVSMGFRLIPLTGKRPACELLPDVDGRPSWKPLLQRPNTQGEIEAWFGSSQANIGLLTGVSGVVAVDCDSLDAATWWDEHRAKTPMVVQTARGRHYFYRVDHRADDVVNRVGVLRQDIDVRAFGGYVVAPPSRHPSGARYRWIGIWKLDEVPWFNPEWGLGSDRVRQVEPIGDTNHTRLRRYILHIKSVSGQRGHDACFRCACKLADAGLSFDAAMKVFREWNEVCARPPWSERQLRHKLIDAFNRGR